MKPNFFFITLGVANLEKSLVFYRDGLGWRSSGTVAKDMFDVATGAHGTIALFKLKNGLLLTLYERHNLAKDAQIALDSISSTEFSLGYQAQSKSEVNRTLQLVKKAGATITAAPHDRPWGIYSGYFKDPDGHLWEIFYRPASPDRP